MTDEEYMKEYPIGTKIRYTGTYSSAFLGESLTDMVGIVVGFKHLYPLVYLPKAKFKSTFSTKKYPVTVQTSWGRIEKLPQEGQLTFDFYTVR